MDVIYYVAVSLDGYIAMPDGGVTWLAPFEKAGEDYGYAEFYGSVDAIDRDRSHEFSYRNQAVDSRGPKSP